jgi:hypothetical protein
MNLNTVLMITTSTVTQTGSLEANDIEDTEAVNIIDALFVSACAQRQAMCAILVSARGAVNDFAIKGSAVFAVPNAVTRNSTPLKRTLQSTASGTDTKHCASS